MKKKAIVLVSGGLDSITLAYLLAAEGYELFFFSSDYGQRHKKELAFAQMAANNLHASYIQSHVYGLFRGSALTDNIPVPYGHYADETMASTVVPNRNAVLLSLAYSLAISEQANAVAIAVHAGDHFIYPDCRPDFIQAFRQMEKLATIGYADPLLELLTPFLSFDKSQIVSLGNRLNVPFDLTWSCYEGKEKHCGKCGTCVERKEAFRNAGVNDPTIYE